MPDVDQRLLRMGVFYDGNFFTHVSNYYKYGHSRHKRISIPGLHEFIRHHVATAEGVDVRYCQIVDAHYFRGRLSAKEADARQVLFYERAFDDILMSEGVVTHYLPVRHGHEKGIDVWLALEAFELAVYKRFNVLVLIGGDSDFIPLARKLNSLGTRVMVLGWDFTYTDNYGQEQTTTTSIHLLGEVTYPVMMHQIIDDKTRRDDPKLKGLFYESSDSSSGALIKEQAAPQQGAGLATDGAPAEATRLQGTILSLHEDGFGFIRHPDYPNNIFFHWQSLNNRDFADLKQSAGVTFEVSAGPKGPIATNIDVE